jgi:hypothetical protein
LSKYSRMKSFVATFAVKIAAARGSGAERKKEERKREEREHQKLRFQIEIKSTGVWPPPPPPPPQHSLSRTLLVVVLAAAAACLSHQSALIGWLQASQAGR